MKTIATIIALFITTTTMAQKTVALNLQGVETSIYGIQEYCTFEWVEATTDFSPNTNTRSVNKADTTFLFHAMGSYNGKFPTKKNYTDVVQELKRVLYENDYDTTGLEIPRYDLMKLLLKQNPGGVINEYDFDEFHANVYFYNDQVVLQIKEKGTK